MPPAGRRSGIERIRAPYLRSCCSRYAPESAFNPTVDSSKALVEPYLPQISPAPSNKSLHIFIDQRDRTALRLLVRTWIIIH